MVLRNVSILFLACLLLLAVGCTDESEMLDAPPVREYPYPDSPEQVMINFRDAYQNLDLQAYAEVLHEDFVFFFQSCDVQDLKLDNPHLNRGEELSSAANMFSGKAVKNSAGNTVPAISSIEFHEFEPVGDWHRTDDPDHLPGALMCTYRVRLRFVRPAATNIYVSGHSIFYVTTGEPGPGARSDRPYYQLVGWIDRTEGCQEKG
jgi:hypothetical protein